MAWQLIYTSAPELLAAGRSGFGTVAKHDAIRSTLQTELERISQFSREQGLSRDRVIFCHRVLDLRGESYHVLSRIRDAGADYTGRTNHIAHHIVLTSAEATRARTSSCTPADMILWASSSGLWRDRWNEPSRLLEPREEIATGGVSARMGLPAVTWKAGTGTAANAAILAPGGAATEGCWLLYRENQSSQLLGLIGESLCLHPDPWAISFTTDTQPTDRIEELRWRGVIAGSPLEQTARQSVRPILDLGNPAVLPSPVESAAHLAETGQLKAPLPSESSRAGSVNPRDSGTSEGSLSRTPSDPFKTGNRSASLSGKVSLKDRMKGSESGKGGNSKGIPFSWFVLGALAILLLLGAFEWSTCIFDQGEFDSIRNSTNRIIHGLTGDKGKEPDEAWWNKMAAEQAVPLWGSLKIVPIGYKQSVSSAKEQLAEIANSNGKNELERNFDDAKRANYPGLLGEIIKKITQQKKDQEIADANAKDKDEKESNKRTQDLNIAASPLQQKTNQTITLKIGGGLVTNSQSIAGTTGQKLLLEAASSSGCSVAISKKSGAGDLMGGNTLTINGVGLITLHLSAAGNEKTHSADMDIQVNIVPPAAKITAIQFTSGNTCTEIFTTESIKGWVFCESDEYAKNLQNLSSFLKTNQWKTNPPLNHADFDERSKKPGHCLFRKDDATQEVSLTITIDPKGLISNALGYQPILIENSGVSYKCKLDPKIAPSIAILKLNNSIEYEVNNVKGQSIEVIEEIINGKNQDYINKVQLAQQAYDNDQKANQQATNSQMFFKPESMLQKYPEFDNAGAKLSEGLVFKKDLDEKTEGFPADLQSYSAWMKSNNQSPSRKTYREYLAKVFGKIRNSKKNVTCPLGNFFRSDDKINDDFQSLGNANTDAGRIKLGWNASSSSTDDGKFEQNLEAYFTESNRNHIAEILDKPRPTPTPKTFVEKLNEAKRDFENFRQQVEGSPKASIKIIDSANHSILIFTP